MKKSLRYVARIATTLEDATRLAFAINREGKGSAELASWAVMGGGVDHQTTVEGVWYNIARLMEDEVEPFRALMVELGVEDHSAKVEAALKFRRESREAALKDAWF